MATRVNQIERWKRLNAELAFELTKYTHCRWVSRG